MKTMIMTTLIIIIATLSSGCSKMEIATDLLLVADWSQTRQIPERDDIEEELNFFLRGDPAKKTIDNYFVGALAVNTMVHRKWPWPKAEKVRKKLLPYYQGGLVAVEINCIGGNYNLGLSIKY